MVSKLNEDVLFLILKELKHERNSLYSCLLVNRTWCKIIIPILWENPWKYLTEAENPRFSAIIVSHLSNEAKETWKGWGIDLPLMQQKPLFNYISFCRHFDSCVSDFIYESTIIRDELLKLFINSNTRFTHLYMPPYLDYQLHLVPGVEYCFSDLKVLSCCCLDSGFLEGLARISKSIKILKIYHIKLIDNDSGAVKLIEAQRNLNDVYFSFSGKINESICKTLEESLIKHANTIQYLRINWVPTTKILSYLVNLISLKIHSSICNTNWNHLENVSLPFLRILEVQDISFKGLISLIGNTKGQLTEVSINDKYVEHNIQAIYQNCPNLEYLKLSLTNSDYLELEQLLINCQQLNGLVIDLNEVLNYNSLFKMLVQSSPPSLYKFKFLRYDIRNLKSLKLFLDNWKDRHPMLLHLILTSTENIYRYFGLMEEYKAKGIVKKYDIYFIMNDEFENFEWIQKKVNRYDYLS